MPSKEDMAYRVAQDEAPAETPAAEGSHDEEGHEDDVQEEEEEDDAEDEPEEEEDEQPESEEAPEEGEEDEGGDRRPNRAERRIHQLTHKLKEQTSPTNAGKAREDSPREAGFELPWKQSEQQSPEQDFVELDPQKLDEMITRRAEEVIEARERAAEQRQQAQGWLSDYEETVKNNPELDPKSKSYNQELDDLLTAIVSNPDGTPKFGVKVSEALGKLRKTLASAKKQGAKNASLKLAQQAEEGALAPGSSDGEAQEYTEDDVRELRINNPRKYQQLIKEGKI
jgi:hypothetical protein